MKVAISSQSFSAQLALGDTTQLEWLECSASTLGADGVVFDRQHFAREDDEYVAQLRKVCIDLGLVPVAVDDANLFTPGRAATGALRSIELAAAMGALFVLSELPEPGAVPPATFVEAISTAKSAVTAAKRYNITLLAQIKPATLAPDVVSLRHFVKDVDSAWLRYALPAGIDRSSLGARDRALLVSLDSTVDLDTCAELEDWARPWLLLRGPVDEARVAHVCCAAAKRTLAKARLK